MFLKKKISVYDELMCHINSVQVPLTIAVENTDVIFSVEVYLLRKTSLNITKSFICNLRLTFLIYL